MDERPRNPGPSQDPRFTQALGRTIKVLRTDHGLSRKDLARQVDMSYSYLTEIENGNKPPSNTILGAIANVLDMHLHELIADAEQRVAPVDYQSELFAMLADAPQDEGLRGGPASPSARRQNAATSWHSRRTESSPDELQPTYPSRRREQERMSPNLNRDPSAGYWELRDLLPRLSPEDLERVLDLVRRLAR